MLFQSHQEYQCLLVFWSVTDAGIQHSECLWKKRRRKHTTKIATTRLANDNYLSVSLSLPAVSCSVWARSIAGCWDGAQCPSSCGALWDSPLPHVQPGNWTQRMLALWNGLHSIKVLSCSTADSHSFLISTQPSPPDVSLGQTSLWCSWWCWEYLLIYWPTSQRRFTTVRLPHFM